MSLSTLLAILVVVFALPLNWVVTFRLWRLSLSNPDLWVLRERAVISLALSLIVTAFALVFLNNEMAVPILGPEQTKVITRGAILCLSIPPAAYWLWRYRNA